MAEETSSGPKRLDIRKYPNRRYYDTSRSRHVTLEEINALIRDGYEIRVTDSKTGQDITAKVLAQIILELDTPKLGVFPVPLLHRLIRANEQIVTDFVDKYFNQALNAFLDSQRTFEQSVRQAMGLQQNLPGIPEWTKLMWGPFANSSVWSGNRPQSAEPAPAPPSPAPVAPVPTPQPQEIRNLVEELKQQVQQLKQQVGEKKKKRSRKAEK